MSGASAMSGTVWLRMTKGSTAHSAMRMPQHEQGEGEPDDDAEEPAEGRDAEAHERGEQHDDAQRQGAGCAGHGFDDARAHLPHVRHRLVARAREQPDARAGDALLGADEPAVGGTDELVELPHRGERGDADRAPDRARSAPRRGLRAPRRASGPFAGDADAPVPSVGAICSAVSVMPSP